ncbi:MAG TPA: helix-turn-helix domain-containing protein [Pseudolabrys sp.]|nr:helix-turn-helix domain-containing protein [Pseudolabrys sp.]
MRSQAKIDHCQTANDVRRAARQARDRRRAWNEPPRPAPVLAAPAEPPADVQPPEPPPPPPPPASPPDVRAPVAAFDEVIDAVATACGIARDVLLTEMVEQRPIEARKLAAALCLRRCRAPVQAVSDYFGMIEAAVGDAARVLDWLFRDFALSRRAPLLQLVRVLQRHWIDELPRPAYSIEQIQIEVARAFAVNRNDMLSPRRAQEIVVPRQVAVALARLLTRRSYPEIGKRFGRDHTTILHTVQKMKPLCDALVREVKSDAPLTVWVRAAKALIETGILRS